MDDDEPPAMNTSTAAFHLVHDYPGGAQALAPLLGKNPATLSHEVNPAYPTAKFGLEDAVKATMLTKDLRILTAFATTCGAMVVSLPDPSNAPDSMSALAASAREFADLVGRVSDACADGVVTPNELRAVEREAGELVAAVQVVVQHLSAMVPKARSERVAA